MGEQPLAYNSAYARTDRVGPLGGDDRKDGLQQRSSSDAETHELPGER